MCGLFGYVGSRESAGILLAGLRPLEYRGYDSAGLATVGSCGLQVRRALGPVARLAELVRAEAVAGTLGIAHTRWATHGPPSLANAHPHIDASCRIALVHNGVVQNQAALRAALAAVGVAFRSETDSEVLAQLVGFHYERTGDLSASVRSALDEVEGAYAVALVCAEHPGLLVAARRSSPLVVGVRGSECFLSSDPGALAPDVERFAPLAEEEIVLLGPEGCFADGGAAVPVALDLALDEGGEYGQVELEDEALGPEAETFPHHMLREIHAQPDALRAALRGRVDLRRNTVVLDELIGRERGLAVCRRLLLFRCGTAWHAALVGQHLVEELARLPARVEYASELRYRHPVIEDGTAGIAVSQSGETADTLAALREVRRLGALALGVVNVPGSALAREADASLSLRVGPEIGVASTKCFLGQVAVLALLAAWLGARRGTLPAERLCEFLAELEALPEKIEQALALAPRIRALAAEYADWADWLYLGRGVQFPVALEGALKLKEVSYLHAEGLPAAEMKHGPLALIEPGMPVVVIAPRDHTHKKVLANIAEVRSRGARVLAVAGTGDELVADAADEVLFVPETDPLLAPLLTVVPLQLLAYHAAALRGLDVDKPRHLAKSVTVE